MRLRQVAHGGEIHQVHHGVGGGLAVDHAGGRREGALHRLDPAHVHEAEGDAVLRVDPLHQAVGAAVDVVTRHDVVTGAKQLERRVEGGEPGAEGEAERPALEARDVPLERLARGVLGAGVFVALVPAQPLLDIGGGLVDRRHDGAGHRVGPLARVHGAGGEAVIAVGREDLRHLPIW